MNISPCCDCCQGGGACCCCCCCCCHGCTGAGGWLNKLGGWVLGAECGGTPSTCWCCCCCQGGRAWPEWVGGASVHGRRENSHMTVMSKGVPKHTYIRRRRNCIVLWETANNTRIRTHKSKSNDLTYQCFRVLCNNCSDLLQWKISKTKNQLWTKNRTTLLSFSSSPANTVHWSISESPISLRPVSLVINNVSQSHVVVGTYINPRLMWLQFDCHVTVMWSTFNKLSVLSGSLLWTL